MTRRSKGYSKSRVQINGKWYGRLRITLPDGSQKSIHRQALNKTNARDVAKELEAIYCAGGLEAVDGRSMTMAELIARFKKDELKPAVYLGERKVSGYKHPKKMQEFLRLIEEYWKAKRMAEITPQDLRQYRDWLIKKPTQHNRPRSPHNVNGLLRILRVLLNYAKRNRWIANSPFEYVTNLINSADEAPRFRPEQPDELEKLLEQCVGRRAHLRHWIVCAIETALRPGEIDRIARKDIDWEAKVIIARATNTKTNRQREVPLTEVLEAELRAWLQSAESSDHWAELIPDEPDALIFGGMKSNKHAFQNACNDAGITNLQRKDLRKWGTTRLVNALEAAGISDLHGMVITGHSQLKTYRSYLITDRPTVAAAREALEKARKKKEE